MATCTCITLFFQCARTKQLTMLKQTAQLLHRRKLEYWYNIFVYRVITLLSDVKRTYYDFPYMQNMQYHTSNNVFLYLSVHLAVFTSVILNIYLNSVLSVVFRLRSGCFCTLGTKQANTCYICMLNNLFTSV